MMEYKHILLIGHPEGYYQFINFLLNKNYKVTWISDKSHDSLKYSDRLIKRQLDIIFDFENAMDTLKMLHKEDPFHAVATHHEFYLLAKNRIAEQLDLPYATEKNLIAATHKYFMKKRFAEYDVPTARFEFLNLKENIKCETERIEKKFPYPFVVKPYHQDTKAQEHVCLCKLLGKRSGNNAGIVYDTTQPISSGSNRFDLL